MIIYNFRQKSIDYVLFGIAEVSDLVPELLENKKPEKLDMRGYGASSMEVDRSSFYFSENILKLDTIVNEIHLQNEVLR